MDQIKPFDRLVSELPQIFFTVCVKNSVNYKGSKKTLSVKEN